MANWCVFFCLFQKESSASGDCGNFKGVNMVNDIRSITGDSLYSQALIADIRQLIEHAKQHVAREYNTTQVLLCWLIGTRIDEEVLKFQRAEYGERIVEAIAIELSAHYGATL
jgi:hypothetical protein